MNPNGRKSVSSNEGTPTISTKSSNGTDASASKKPLNKPQTFLGENSALVNLDHLIKPVVTQSSSNAAAYNPFSDNILAPKPNLFQQQQPPVSIIHIYIYGNFQYIFIIVSLIRCRPLIN